MLFGMVTTMTYIMLLAQCRFLLRGITVNENLEPFTLFRNGMRFVLSIPPPAGKDLQQKKEKLSSVLQASQCR